MLINLQTILSTPIGKIAENLPDYTPTGLVFKNGQLPLVCAELGLGVPVGVGVIGVTTDDPNTVVECFVHININTSKVLCLDFYDEVDITPELYGATTPEILHREQITNIRAAEFMYDLSNVEI